MILTPASSASMAGCQPPSGPSGAPSADQMLPKILTNVILQGYFKVISGNLFVLGLFWDRFGTTLGPRWGHFEADHK